MDYLSIIQSFSVSEYCQKNHIKRMAFFGSILRPDFTDASDIDILVEFEPGHTPGLKFFLLQDELSRLLGRKVDLQTAGFLGEKIYSSVRAEAVPVYEQA
jgi:predicted nucleotidyltransferase